VAHQNHRGQHPEDARLFAEKHVANLREATEDLSLLLSRNYSRDAALKLVGDHYQLDVRQRRAILRGACGDASLHCRDRHRVVRDELEGQTVWIDGYNLIIMTESVLAGGILLRGRDGCVRDMASVHGSYRKVAETLPAIRLLGTVLQELKVAKAVWLLDAPVSNSGRLKIRLLEEAADPGWNWEVNVVNSVDQRLCNCDDIVVTSDGGILDRVQRWANVSDRILDKSDAARRVIDLGTMEPLP